MKPKNRRTSNQRAKGRTSIEAILLQILMFCSFFTFAQPPMQTIPEPGEHPFETVYNNYSLLLANPDTNLNATKKQVERWMAYTLPKLEVVDGKLSNEPFTTAMRGAYSTLAACGSDPANWVSDGPTFTAGNQRADNGWIDAVYHHPNNINTFLIGTRTSGIMRTTNGGENWTCVTDDLDFPVLGVRQLAGAPNNADIVIGVSGSEKIKGSVIWSTDGGLEWNECQQELPQFYGLDFHPSINGLVFATGQDGIYYSTDYGENWTSLGAPSDFPTNILANFRQILVFENNIWFNTIYPFDGARCELYEGSFSVQNGVVSITFNNDMASQVLPDYTPEFNVSKAYLSTNKVGDRFYLHCQSIRPSIVVDNVEIQTEMIKNYILESNDAGSTFDLIRTSPAPDLADKNELVASVNNGDVFYLGSVWQPRRYTEGVTNSKLINGTSGNNGHHPDYRSSHIISVNGQDQIAFGNDGGIGLVIDGLATNPTISNINGNLSNNLIHAFDVHERTGRVAFGFQDHLMIYRDTDGSYSSRFIGEGSLAMIQQTSHDAIVGEAGYGSGGIRDWPISTNKIVTSGIGSSSPGTLAPGRCLLGTYFIPYRHYPERFARGLTRLLDEDDNVLNKGGVAFNRAKLVSEVVDIDICQGDIGPVAICETQPEIVYAAEGKRLDFDAVLFKSSNDGATWTDLSEAIVSSVDGTTPLNSLVMWRHIRALAVNHRDPDVLYCGLGGAISLNTEFTAGKLRVIKSTDGGASFADFSDGLPALPVERLLTIDTDDNLIFVGTSAGVFYRNDNMTQWECFSNGLPKVEITGMKFDYCNKVLYVSTYGRGLWKTPVDFPITNSSALEINEDELWDEDRIIHENVLVKAGNTLTITSRVEIATMKAIMVEQNATLIVDGGHLTNFCNSAWRGIEVWGDTDENQYASNGNYHQGRAIFKNGATIENAWQGVMNWKPGDWNSLGGIIQARNTTFLNNRIDAIFMSYQNTQTIGSITFLRADRSYFRECAFEINDNHLDDANVLTPRPRITMWKTDRLQIVGCSFINDQTVDASEKRGHAIYSHDANYIIKEKCTVNGGSCPEEFKTYNTFTGWHKGIEAVGTEGSRPISVRNSIFDENMIGIELGGADYSEIYANEFLIGGHPYEYEIPVQMEDQNHLGLYSNGTQHFAIEQNEFIKPVTGAPYDAHGVLIESSEGAENEVYNNEFTRLKTGANAFQINRNTSNEGGAQVGYAGLQFKCNTNSQNEVDFEISRSGVPLSQPFENAGIRFRQGDYDPQTSAGNTFSATNSNPLIYSHWTVNSTPSYNYYTTQAQSPDPNEIGPDELSIEVNTTQNNCPANFTTGFTGSGGITELLIKKAEFEGLLYTYNQLVDNGNTPGTITEIQLTWPQQAWQLRDQLMAVSPYNSEAVLMAAIQQNIMPHAMLLEVLLANPDALRSGQVIQHAANVPIPPMPSYMIDLLWAARDQTTLRTAMESTIADLHLDVQRLQKKIIIRNAFADSTSSGPDSTLYYLSLVKTVEGNYSRAAALMDRNMHGQAIALIDSMQVNYRLTGKQYMEMTALKNLYTLLASAHSSGKTVANLDSTAINAMRAIAENATAGVAAQKAQNALCFHYSICYDAQGQPKSNGGARKPKPTYEELLSKLNTNTAYPNPTDQYVTIAYTFLHAKEESTLHIFDNLGRQIRELNLGEVYEGQQLIDTRKLSNGVYPYQIVQDGKKVSEGKIVITR